jgi:hypothetical protein
VTDRTPRTEAGRLYVEWDEAAVEGGPIETLLGRHWTTRDAILAIEAEARAELDVRWGKTAYCSVHQRFCERPIGPHRAAVDRSKS